MLPPHEFWWVQNVCAFEEPSVRCGEIMILDTPVFRSAAIKTQLTKKNIKSNDKPQEGIWQLSNDPGQSPSA